jgi:hypothetical protein
MLGKKVRVILRTLNKFYVGTVIHVFEKNKLPDPALIDKYYGNKAVHLRTRLVRVDRLVVEYQQNKYIVVPVSAGTLSGNNPYTKIELMS